jgi:hypothetical protein
MSINQEIFKMTITADNIVSTDDRFTIDDLSLGDNYKPINVYYQNNFGEIIVRKRSSNERTISNQTLPRLVCQIFEKNIENLSVEEKLEFPICKYYPYSEVIKGIYSTEGEFREYRNSMEFTVYKGEGGAQFVFYSWNVFSTIIFAKECLKRFGNSKDRIVFEYREKTEEEKNQNTNEKSVKDNIEDTAIGCKNPYSKMLLESKNIIFRGAPGTGKSYVARQIATDIVSNGSENDYSKLTEEQKNQIEFVQFHPSYDYSDFVEGLRPKINEDGTMGFELHDGIFKRFVDIARRNFEDSKKSKAILEQEVSVQAELKNFFDNIEYGETTFKTITGNKFIITDVDEVKKRIYIDIPGNKTINKLILNIDEIRLMLESGSEFNKISDITSFFGKQFATQGYSYDFAIFKEIKSKRFKPSSVDENKEKLKKYVFIIDEINRGEVSKILGELFFTIDPGYRGISGSVTTQYSNMHTNQHDKFYIPENIYIIGTMNDIDRSVESIDFAMRRRFRFIEIRAKDTQNMLDLLEDDALKDEAIARMDRLNEEILKVEDLNENYQIGASYFLKLKILDFDELWTDYIRPLLKEYIHGLYGEYDIMKRFETAYGYIGLYS